MQIFYTLKKTISLFWSDTMKVGHGTLQPKDRKSIWLPQVLNTLTNHEYLDVSHQHFPLRARQELNRAHSFAITGSIEMFYNEPRNFQCLGTMNMLVQALISSW